MGKELSSMVLRYMDQHNGRRVYRHDIATELGITEPQVRGVVYDLRRNDPTLEKQIEVVRQGQCWIMHSPDSPKAAPLAAVVEPEEEVAVPVKVKVHKRVPREPAPANEKAFTYVGLGLEGYILRDESGKVYVAKPL